MGHHHIGSDRASRRPGTSTPYSAIQIVGNRFGGCSHPIVKTANVRHLTMRGNVMREKPAGEEARCAIARHQAGVLECSNNESAG